MNITQEELQQIIEEELEAVLNEKCQKGYKTHPTRKTKEMFGKTYRNCVKAEEGQELDEDIDEAKAYHWDEPDWEYGGGYGDAEARDSKWYIAEAELEEKKKKKAGTESGKESSLRDWFGRKGAKGKKKGWVDCNAPDGKGGYKSCGRGSGEKRKKYPACRPTPSACKERGKGKSWGKKAKKRGKKK